MLILPIKKKKGSFLIALYNHREYKAYLQTVDGYLFEYKGYKFGLYKSFYRNEGYIVVDIKTGYTFTIFYKLKDIQIELEKKWDKFIELIKTEKYERYINHRETLEIDNTSISPSIYCWEVKQ